MSAQTLYHMVSSIARILRTLDNQDIRIEVGGDFSEYRRLRNANAERLGLYPMFDVSSSYVDASNAFWICGFDRRDELVHTQAIRLLDLHGANLETHLREHRHKYITPDTTPDPDATFYSGPQALATIAGRVCYHGDFWLKSKDDGGPRGRGLTPLLARVAFELATKSWEPDYFFGLLQTRYAMKGLHYRYGYFHCEPGHWYGPDQQITDEECLTWMSSDDVRGFLAIDIEELESFPLDFKPSAKIQSIDLKG